MPYLYNYIPKQSGKTKIKTSSHRPIALTPDKRARIHMVIPHTKNARTEDRIIYALDFASAEDAINEIDKLYPHIKFFKVGLELFLASGWQVVDYIIKKGGKVMLDLKFLDIPATVAGAVKQVNRHQGISLLTVHGHQQTIAAAVDARDDIAMSILGVTLLTSFGPEDMLEFGNDASGELVSPEELVEARAISSLAAGADGLVASPMEAPKIRQECGKNFVVVTPGIRLDIIDGDDQRRIATPSMAVANGSDYLVIGRPIRDAADPIEVINSIKQELASL